MIAICRPDQGRTTLLVCGPNAGPSDEQPTNTRVVPRGSGRDQWQVQRGVPSPRSCRGLGNGWRRRSGLARRRWLGRRYGRGRTGGRKGCRQQHHRRSLPRRVHSRVPFRGHEGSKQARECRARQWPAEPGDEEVTMSRTYTAGGAQERQAAHRREDSSRRVPQSARLLAGTAINTRPAIKGIPASHPATLNAPACWSWRLMFGAPPRPAVSPCKVWCNGSAPCQKLRSPTKHLCLRSAALDSQSPHVVIDPQVVLRVREIERLPVPAEGVDGATIRARNDRGVEVVLRQIRGGRVPGGAR